VGTRRVPTPLAEVFRAILENPPLCALEEVDLGLEWRISLLLGRDDKRARTSG